MKLESHSTYAVTTETYNFITKQGPVTYMEYINDKGKVTDCNLRDEDGNEINDPVLLEKIQFFVDNIDEQLRRDEKNGLYPDKADIAN